MKDIKLAFTDQAFEKVPQLVEIFQYSYECIPFESELQIFPHGEIIKPLHSTTEEIISEFGFAATTAKRYLRQLSEFGYLEVRGGNKNRSYIKIK